jgi:hypothetical protein
MSHRHSSSPSCAPRLRFVSFAVIALVGCGADTPTDPAADEVPDPPAVETRSFRAALQPEGFAAPVTYRWSPEPDGGQGTPLARYGLLELEEGTVGVTVEACGAFQSHVLELEAAQPAAAAAQQPADVDDFRTIQLNQTLSGNIQPAGDIDVYYFFGTVGQRISVRMDRTSGDLDPYLHLLSPSGVQVAINNNGGGGVNALINGYFVPQNGRYTIYARDARGSVGTGGYRVSVQSGAEALNPAPSITRLSPTSASGTVFGSDFWVAIYGSGFTADSRTRWNGSLRSHYFSNSGLVYIRVRGSDLGLPWPRNAFVTVHNPAPGGGTSNSRAFTIDVPFLGETVMESPAAGSAAVADEAVPFRLTWTHPTDSWRVMRYMEMRLHDLEGEILVRLRATEGAGATSTLGLHDAEGELIGEGLPGEARVIAAGDVTLDLGPSTIGGSGSEVTMNGALRFGPSAAGTYTVEFGIVPKEGDAQEGDVLGTFGVLPAGCDQALAGVTIEPVG